jgi:hypothetical protein
MDVPAGGCNDSLPQYHFIKLMNQFLPAASLMTENGFEIVF